MRNHEVTESHNLLDEKGMLIEPGWSKALIQRYDRKQIKASKFKIKEWDYYLVLNDDFAGAFTLSDDGYIGLQSVSFLNLKEGWEHTETILNPLPLGKMKMPKTSAQGDIAYEDKKLSLSYKHETVSYDDAVKMYGDAITSEDKKLGRCKIRHISCVMFDFYEGKTFSADIKLYQTKMDTMVIATPWEEKLTAFYYNQKINCMPAYGYMKLGEDEFVFDPSINYGTLDWGRGVWTYDNRWYWGSGNGTVNGKPFGFNIGYGFGNTSAASENILFYDGICHKLDDVTFNIPSSSYTDPWTITSSDGRFEMDFVPVIDRAARINAGIIESDQHQVFGRMSGNVILDDGTKLEIKDLMCFAEDVHNRY